MSSEVGPEVHTFANDSDYPVQIECYEDYYSAVWFSPIGIDTMMNIYWVNEDRFETSHLIYSEKIEENIEIQLDHLDEYRPVTFLRIFGEEFDLTWEEEEGYSIVGFVSNSLSTEKLLSVHHTTTGVRLSASDIAQISELATSM